LWSVKSVLVIGFAGNVTAVLLHPKSDLSGIKPLLKMSRILSHQHFLNREANLPNLL